MKILVLEDDELKHQAIDSFFSNQLEVPHVQYIRTFRDFCKSIEREKYNLIVLDLLVPQFEEDADSIDVTEHIIDSLRDRDCINFRTPAIALTAYDNVADDKYKQLNNIDIAVITYSSSDQKWQASLQEKFERCNVREPVDVVIVCALAEEVQGFIDAKYQIGPLVEILGFHARRFSLNDKKGIIFQLPRMGLVASAIGCERIIGELAPKVICMAGICGGVRGRSKVYDTVIAQSCYQHDFGKWTSDGFMSEIYSVQISHEAQVKIESIISEKEFKDCVLNDINLLRCEYAEDEFDPRFYFGSASSGNAVISSEQSASVISEQHRKTCIFEMEAAAMYEVCRLAKIQPIFFSVKTVVDDGINKNDSFHRVACLLSAKSTFEILRMSDMLAVES